MITNRIERELDRAKRQRVAQALVRSYTNADYVTHPDPKISLPPGVGDDIKIIITARANGCVVNRADTATNDHMLSDAVRQILVNDVKKHLRQYHLTDIVADIGSNGQRLLNQGLILHQNLAQMSVTDGRRTSRLVELLSKGMTNDVMGDEKFTARCLDILRGPIKSRNDKLSTKGQCNCELMSQTFRAGGYDNAPVELSLQEDHVYDGDDAMMICNPHDETPAICYGEVCVFKSDVSVYLDSTADIDCARVITDCWRRGSKRVYVLTELPLGLLEGTLFGHDSLTGTTWSDSSISDYVENASSQVLIPYGRAYTKLDLIDRIKETFQQLLGLDSFQPSDYLTFHHGTSYYYHKVSTISTWFLPQTFVVVTPFGCLTVNSTVMNSIGFKYLFDIQIRETHYSDLFSCLSNPQWFTERIDIPHGVIMREVRNGGRKLITPARIDLPKTMFDSAFAPVAFGKTELGTKVNLVNASLRRTVFNGVSMKPGTSMSPCKAPIVTATMLEWSETHREEQVPADSSELDSFFGSKSLTKHSLRRTHQARFLLLRREAIRNNKVIIRYTDSIFKQCVPAFMISDDVSLCDLCNILHVPHLVTKLPPDLPCFDDWRFALCQNIDLMEQMLDAIRSLDQDVNLLVTPELAERLIEGDDRLVHDDPFSGQAHAEPLTPTAPLLESEVIDQPMASEMTSDRVSEALMTVGRRLADMIQSPVPADVDALVWSPYDGLSLERSIPVAEKNGQNVIDVIDDAITIRPTILRTLRCQSNKSAQAKIYLDDECRSKATNWRDDKGGYDLTPGSYTPSSCRYDDLPAKSTQVNMQFTKKQLAKACFTCSPITGVEKRNCNHAYKVINRLNAAGLYEQTLVHCPVSSNGSIEPHETAIRVRRCDTLTIPIHNVEPVFTHKFDPIHLLSVQRSRMHHARTRVEKIQYTRPVVVINEHARFQSEIINPNSLRIRHVDSRYATPRDWMERRLRHGVYLDTEDAAKSKKYLDSEKVASYVLNRIVRDDDDIIVEDVVDDLLSEVVKLESIEKEQSVQGSIDMQPGLIQHHINNDDEVTHGVTFVPSAWSRDVQYCYGEFPLDVVRRMPMSRHLEELLTAVEFLHSSRDVCELLGYPTLDLKILIPECYGLPVEIFQSVVGFMTSTSIMSTVNRILFLQALNILRSAPYNGDYALYNADMLECDGLLIVDANEVPEDCYVFEVDTKLFKQSSDCKGKVIHRSDYDTPCPELILQSFAMLQPFRYSRAALLVLEGVPGAGKTSTLVRAVRENDVVLGTKKAPVEDMRTHKRFAGYEEGWRKNHIRTLDSYMIHRPDVGNVGTLFIDEIYACHAGQVYCAINSLQPKKVIGVGDREQCGYHNSVLDITLFNGLQITMSFYLNISRRCPQSAIRLLRSVYPNGIFTLNEHEGELTVKGSVPAPELGPEKLITLSQADKESIRTGYDPFVKTASEVQGAQWEDVSICRLMTAQPKIYMHGTGGVPTPPAVVAVSRHTRSLKYTTPLVIDADPMASWISNCPPPDDKTLKTEEEWLAQQTQVVKAMEEWPNSPQRLRIVDAKHNCCWARSGSIVFSIIIYYPMSASLFNKVFEAYRKDEATNTLQAIAKLGAILTATDLRLPPWVGDDVALWHNNRETHVMAERVSSKQPSGYYEAKRFGYNREALRQYIRKRSAMANELSIEKHYAVSTQYKTIVDGNNVPLAKVDVPYFVGPGERVLARLEVESYTHCFEHGGQIYKPFILRNTDYVIYNRAALIYEESYSVIGDQVMPDDGFKAGSLAIKQVQNFSDTIHQDVSSASCLHIAVLPEQVRHTTSALDVSVKRSKTRMNAVNHNVKAEYILTKERNVYKDKRNSRTVYNCHLQIQCGGNIIDVKDISVRAHCTLFHLENVSVLNVGVDNRCFSGKKLEVVYPDRFESTVYLEVDNTTSETFTSVLKTRLRNIALERGGTLIISVLHATTNEVRGVMSNFCDQFKKNAITVPLGSDLIRGDATFHFYGYQSSSGTDEISYHLAEYYISVVQPARAITARTDYVGEPVTPYEAYNSLTSKVPLPVLPMHVCNKSPVNPVIPLETESDMSALQVKIDCDMRVMILHTSKPYAWVETPQEEFAGLVLIDPIPIPMVAQKPERLESWTKMVTRFTCNPAAYYGPDDIAYLNGENFSFTVYEYRAMVKDNHVSVSNDAVSVECSDMTMYFPSKLRDEKKRLVKLKIDAVPPCYVKFLYAQTEFFPNIHDQQHLIYEINVPSMLLFWQRVYDHNPNWQDEINRVIDLYAGTGKLTRWIRLNDAVEVVLYEWDSQLVSALRRRDANQYQYVDGDFVVANPPWDQPQCMDVLTNKNSAVIHAGAIIAQQPNGAWDERCVIVQSSAVTMTQRLALFHAPKKDEGSQIPQIDSTAEKPQIHVQREYVLGLGVDNALRCNIVTGDSTFKVDLPANISNTDTWILLQRVAYILPHIRNLFGRKITSVTISKCNLHVDDQLVFEKFVGDTCYYQCVFVDCQHTDPIDKLDAKVTPIPPAIFIDASYRFRGQTMKCNNVDFRAMRDELSKAQMRFLLTGSRTTRDEYSLQRFYPSRAGDKLFEIIATSQCLLVKKPAIVIELGAAADDNKLGSMSEVVLDNYQSIKQYVAVDIRHMESRDERVHIFIHDITDDSFLKELCLITDDSCDLVIADLCDKKTYDLSDTKYAFLLERTFMVITTLHSSTFIIKLFEALHPDTQAFVRQLMWKYNLRFIKPDHSRTISSEFYIVGTLGSAQPDDIDNYNYFSIHIVQRQIQALNDYSSHRHPDMHIEPAAPSRKGARSAGSLPVQRSAGYALGCDDIVINTWTHEYNDAIDHTGQPRPAMTKASERFVCTHDDSTDTIAHGLHADEIHEAIISKPKKKFWNRGIRVKFSVPKNMECRFDMVGHKIRSVPKLFDKYAHYFVNKYIICVQRNGHTTRNNRSRVRNYTGTVEITLADRDVANLTHIDDVFIELDEHVKPSHIRVPMGHPLTDVTLYGRHYCSIESCKCRSKRTMSHEDLRHNDVLMEKYRAMLAIANASRTYTEYLKNVMLSTSEPLPNSDKLKKLADHSSWVTIMGCHAGKDISVASLTGTRFNSESICKASPMVGYRTRICGFCRVPQYEIPGNKHGAIFEAVGRPIFRPSPHCTTKTAYPMQVEVFDPKHFPNLTKLKDDAAQKIVVNCAGLASEAVPNFRDFNQYPYIYDVTGTIEPPFNTSEMVIAAANAYLAESFPRLIETALLPRFESIQDAFSDHEYSCEKVRFTMAKLFDKLQSVDYNVPRILTGIPSKVPNTVSSLLRAVCKRNANPPRLRSECPEHIVVAASISCWLRYACIDNAIPILREFMNDPIEITHHSVARWLASSVDDAKTKKLTAKLDTLASGIYDTPYNFFSIDLKRQLKVRVDSSHVDAIPAAQTLVAAEPQATAYFSNIGRELERRVEMLLRPNILLPWSNTVQNCDEWLTAHLCGVDPADVVCHEIDISKYDKSLDRVHQTILINVMKLLGVSEALIPLIQISMQNVQAYSFRFSMAFTFKPSMRTGCWYTLFGNTMLNMIACSYVYREHLRNSYASSFVGDDSALILKTVPTADVVQQFSDHCNFEAKLFVASIDQRSKALYYCGGFIMYNNATSSWMRIPDPIKRLFKLGIPRIKEEDEMIERFEALQQDAMKWRKTGIYNYLSVICDSMYNTRNSALAIDAVISAASDFSLYKNLWGETVKITF